MSKPYVEVEVDEVLHETDAAFLFQVGEREVWLPKSQLEAPEDISVAECDVVVLVAKWIADKAELDYEEVTWR